MLKVLFSLALAVAQVCAFAAVPTVTKYVDQNGRLMVTLLQDKCTYVSDTVGPKGNRSVVCIPDTPVTIGLTDKVEWTKSGVVTKYFTRGGKLFFVFVFAKCTYVSSTTGPKGNRTVVCIPE